MRNTKRKRRPLSEQKKTNQGAIAAARVHWGGTRIIRGQQRTKRKEKNVLPQNKNKSRRKCRSGCCDCFSIGMTWIVKSSAGNFHLWTALQKTSNISFEGFYWYKDDLSGNFLCAKIFWEKFPSPPQTKIWLLTCDSSVSLVGCDCDAQKRKTNLRSHDLKMDR